MHSVSLSSYHRERGLVNLGLVFHGFTFPSRCADELLVQLNTCLPELATAKSKPQYVTKTSGGGKWTVLILAISALLTMSELGRWWRGHEDHTFAVEKDVGRDLQINLDMVVAMRCPDVHINVQDASGDRILAATVLKTELTNWLQWVDTKGQRQLGRDVDGRVVSGEGWQMDDQDEGFGEEHVHDIIASAKRTNKWAKTPKIKGQPRDGDSCRIFGSLLLNKVQGDFHITARGHGYHELTIPGHLEHNCTYSNALGLDCWSGWCTY